MYRKNDHGPEGRHAVLIPYLLEDAEPHDSILIFPGGGYDHVSLQKEGEAVAAAVNGQHLNAFVLDYRVKPFAFREILSDAVWAVRRVQSEGRKGSVGKKLAVMGFSAGGHLALTETEHRTEGMTGESGLSYESGRPDALILCYPVVTFTGPFAHKNSRNNFLGFGNGPDAEQDDLLCEMFSAEKHVGPDFPPAFLWHCEGDASVPAENSLLLKNALDAAGITNQLILYPGGSHGLGLASGDEVISTWFPECIAWLRGQGFH